ncbi:hypothetical protein OROGR_016273 [Orobanche gracilis]
MKLDVNALRDLCKEDFRVLTAVEMGMRNHEIVPKELIARIASLKHGGTYKVLSNLLRHKLVHHDSASYDGFRLTYLGYDFLAIKTLVNRGVFAGVGRQIGVGKESDIFEVVTEDGIVLAMKLHRLGRTSFRAVKSKRDYLRHRSSFNWLYLSRLAALKEFAFMKALEEHGFPVPHAVDCNRHCVIMSLIQGYPLVKMPGARLSVSASSVQVKQLQNREKIFETILGLVVRLAEHGLIHCDFNEFNIMIDDDEKITMIDFPQMVSASHQNAKMYFDRDIGCIFKFFRKRFNLFFDDHEVESINLDLGSEESCRPQFSDIKKVTGFLDKKLEASGFTRKDQEDMEKSFIDKDLEEDGGSDCEESEDEEDNADPVNGASLKNLESLSLEGDNLLETSNRNNVQEDISNEHSRTGSEPVENRQVENEGNDGDDTQDGFEDDDDDPQLMKSLSKQRRQAIKAAHGRKIITSRNTYKDKGGRSSHNSKVQTQLDIWG